MVRVEAKAGQGERKTSVMSSGMFGLLSPYQSARPVGVLPKPTAANLRRFAETPVARRAINCIKDRIACMVSGEASG